MSLIGQIVPLSQEVAPQDCLLKWILFSSVKDDLSFGADPMILQTYGQGVMPVVRLVVDNISGIHYSSATDAVHIFYQPYIIISS